MNKIAFCDIETDNLLDKVTTIWCAVAYLEDTGKYLIYPTNCQSVDVWLKRLEGYKLCFHNGVAFDLQVLKKLFNYDYDLKNVVDTLILSKLYYPDREGHSLEYWGKKLGLHKGDFHDFSKFSQEMLNYCIRDVDLLRKLYFTLQSQEEDWDWEEAIKLSNYFTDIITRQEQHGVLFDKISAEVLLKELEAEILEIEERLYKEMPHRVVQQGATINKPFLKSGQLTKAAQAFVDTL